MSFTNTAFRNAVRPRPAVARAIRALGGPILRTRFAQGRFRSKIAEVDIHYRGGVEAAASLAWAGEVLLDRDGEAHAVLGAERGCAVVVRPDWYLGFRGPLAECGAAVEYLEAILERPATPA